MSHEEIIATLTAPDPEVRETAYEDVSMEMDEELARAIVDIAAGNHDDEIRADAIVALGPLIEECADDYIAGFEWGPELGPPVSRETFHSLVQRLRAMYDDESEPKVVRRRAFEVLVRDPQPWQDDEIRKLFASPDEEWRLTAIFGMGAMTGFEKELLEVVTHGEGVQLAEAVRSAGKIELKKAARTIRNFATSNKTERDLRLEAIRALPNVDADSFGVLEELSQSKDPEIAEAAEDAMEELTLNEAIDDEDLGGE